MTVLATFDKHDTIKYNDLSRPFWGRYVFKVVVNHPKSPPGKFWEPENQEKRNAFHQSVLSCCDDLIHDWRVMRGNDCTNLFFEDAATASLVIDRLRDHVSVVFRPINEKSKQLLLRDQRSVCREKLFWNMFKWCIVFRNTLDDAINADQCIDGLFKGEISGRDYPLDDDRLFYSFTSPRRLYLRSETDLMFVMFAGSELIQRIEHVILKKDITNEHWTEQKAG